MCMRGSPTASTWSATRESRHAIQAAGTTGPRDHTYLNLGTFYLHGKSQQGFVGAVASGNPSLLYAREPYYRAGGDFSFNYRTFNLFGVYMFGPDNNLLPVDASGALIPLPLGSTSPLPVGFHHQRPGQVQRRVCGGRLPGSAVDHGDWPLGWRELQRRPDQRARCSTARTSYFGPLRSTRNRFTPGIQFLIHPNIKASFEYQFRPKQIVAGGTDPATGEQQALNPFRVNTAGCGSGIRVLKDRKD